MKLLFDGLRYGRAHRLQDKMSHKIMKKMAKLERKLRRYSVNQSGNSGSSSDTSSDDCRRHRSRRGTRSRSRSRGKHHAGHHKDGRRSYSPSSSSSSSSSSTSNSSLSRSPSPPGHDRHPHRHHRHHHHHHRHQPHHHGPPHPMGRSRSFGGHPSGPVFPWGRHHHHRFQQLHLPGPAPHEPAHHRRARSRRHHRHLENGVPGLFALINQAEEVPTNGCCEEAQLQPENLSANGEEEATAARNGEEMDVEVVVDGQETEPEEEPERGPEISGNLAENWTNIIEKGLPDDKRTSLIKKYPVSINCLLLQAPKINKEILTVAPKSAVERDSARMQEQNQIGAGLVALGQVISDLEHNVHKNRDIAAMNETLKNAAEIIVDVHHNMTQTRQALMSSELHRRIRPFLENCKPDGLLYGNDFGEKIKNVKDFRKTRRSQRPESQSKKDDKRKSKRLEDRGCGSCRRGSEQQ